MSAADKLRDLHERMPPVSWRVWEYADGSAYLEHTEGIGHSGFIVEIRENKTNNLDALVDACDLRNALPDIIAVIAAAERVWHPKQSDGCHCTWEVPDKITAPVVIKAECEPCAAYRLMTDALAALNARLTDTRDGGAA